MSEASGPSQPDDEREFLLRSLEDLEREHDAGDLADDDYQALRDDYTARAAALLRAEPVAPPAPVRSDRRRGLLVLGAVVAFAVVAGVLVAQASGRRDPGDTASGSVEQSVTERLNEARRCFNSGDGACAIEIYDEVLAEQPTNAEALTYKGWAQFVLEGDASAALTSLLDAATADPEYPDVHAFLAVLFFRSGLVQQASNELDRLDALDPPPYVLELVSGLRAEIDAALAGAAGSTSTTAG
jgi:tetratricopeptide (TPR) repeat protein